MRLIQVLVIRLFTLTLFLLLFFHHSGAQPGTLDPTFNPNDLGAYSAANSNVQTVALQTDGKIFIGGYFTTYNGVGISRVARLNSDGTLDPSFSPGTGANGYVLASVLQSDGKIIIGGSFTSFNGIGRNRIARLNSDGTLDLSFNPGTGANNQIQTVTIQPDGKILISGHFTTYNGVSRNRVARLNINGTLDTSFSPGTGANSGVLAICLQPDGKIIMGGGFTTYAGITRNYIARLNSNGTIDPTFNPGTGANSFVHAVKYLTDGKIIIAGVFTTFNGLSRNRIARLSSTGTLDASFNTGTGPNGAVSSVLIQPDGSMIIGGSFTQCNGIGRNNVARMTSNGNIDLTFDPGTGAGGASSSINASILQSDSKIIVGGGFATFNGFIRNYIARLNSNGSLDITFGSSKGVNNSIYTSRIQSDGKILIGGNFTTVDDIITNRIGRLNSDGTRDASFNSLGNGADNYVYSIALQADGKIIVGGDFTFYNGVNLNRIMRLNTDGTIDPSFNLGTGANGWIYTTVIQPDGKIVIGGAFTTYNGISRNRIARLNSDGTLDTSFNPGTGANGFVLSSIIQSDGKIIIGGSFTSYNGGVMNYIARLNSNGTLDATFNTGTGPDNWVYSAAIQSDGKIVIGGLFITYNGVSKKYVARLNSNGTLDSSFNTGGAGANGDISTILVQPSGKIVIGGSFTNFNGVGKNRIARLNNDGTIDPVFNPGVGANNNILSTSLQSDGKLIIAGFFTSYNGTGRSRVARILLNQQDQTIAFGSIPNKVYGDAPFSLLATASSGLPVSFNSSNPSVASINGNTITIVGSGSAVITASQPGDDIWNSAPNVQHTLAVAKAMLNATADNKTRVYNSNNPTFTISYSGFVSGESILVIDTQPIASTTATSTTNVGSYPITPTGGVDNNYAFNYINGTLTITKANQIITFAPIPEQCSFGTIQLSATSNSGLPVSFTSSNTSVATISGNTANVIGFGSSTITANQSGDANYYPAVPVQQLLFVSNPVGRIFQSGDLCLDGLVTLTAGNGSGYSWSTGQISQQITVYEPGTYSVVYYTSAGCEVYASATVVSTGGPDPCTMARKKKENGEITVEGSDLFVSSLSVYPNPADESLTVHFPNEVDQDIDIKLFNVTGVEVLSSMLKKGDSKKSVSTYQLLPGFYLIQLESRIGPLTRRKIIISHP